MAHDWLRELFLRWGRKPARRAARPRIAVEALESRWVPTVNPQFALLPDPGPALGGADGFQPGPELFASPTEIAVGVQGADPQAVLDALLALPGGPAFDLRRTEPVILNGAEGMFQVGLAAGTTPQAAIDWLSGRAGVEFATPNYYTRTDPRLFEPNDPLFGQQYHLDRIQAKRAWDVTTGSPSVIIAITDDGVLDSHPDLNANMWVNPNFSDTSAPAAGGKYGISPYFDSTDPNYRYSRPAPDNANNPGGDYHGNHVAGIAAAVTDNATGVAGVAGGKSGAPGSRIMSIRTYANEGGANGVPGLGDGLFALSIARSMRFATDNGAKVINSSFVTGNFTDSAGTTDPVLREAFDYLYERGVVHVIAAGNDNSANTTNMQYTHGLIVSSSNSQDVKSSFSNYGFGVDITAPGSEILATWVSGAEGVNQQYFAIDGTSMAAPVVSGVAALVWAAFPQWSAGWDTMTAESKQLARDKVTAQVLGSADSSFYASNPNFLEQLGSGRVNAFRAVTEVLPAPRFNATPGLPAANSTTTGLSGFSLRSPFRFNPAVVNSGSPNTGTIKTDSFELRGAGADGQFNTPDDVLVPLSINNGRAYRIATNAFSFGFPALGPGQYKFTAFASKLSDPFGKALDGNGDGTGGDDFVRVFTANPALSGTVFEDYNGTGVADSNDVGAGGVTVYVDRDEDGVRDASEQSVITGGGGRFSFGTVAPGAFTVRVEVPTGFGATAGGQSYPVTLAGGGTGVGGLNFGLARLGAVYGTTFADPDLDGRRATNDPGVAGLTVLLDSDNDGQFDAPTATRTFTGSNPTAVPIPDNGSAGSPITITGASGRISNLTLTVTADSTYTGLNALLNLTLTLVAPDGTRVILIGYLDNASRMVDTVLDSAAGTSIRSGLGALTGRFRPLGDLRAFNGLSPNGTWVLEGVDNQLNGLEPPASESTIRRWALNLTTTDGEQQVVTGPTGGFRFDAAAGAYNLRVIRQRGFALTAPAGGYSVPVTTAAGALAPTTAFGLNEDNVVPRLLSISPTGANATNSPVFDYRVTFSEPIEGLALGNFTLNSGGFATPPTLTSLTTASTPGVYLVRVTTPGGSGQVDLDLTATTLTDFALNPLAGVPAQGDPVTVDTLGPTVSLTIAPNSGGTQVYTFANFPGQVRGTFADVGTGVQDVQVTVRQQNSGLYFDGTSFASEAPVPVSAQLDFASQTYTLAIPASVLAEGQYEATAVARDAAGNTQAAAGPPLAFGLDVGAPTTDISPAAGTLVNARPIPFVVSFSEGVQETTLAPDKLTVTGGTLGAVTGGGATFTVNVVPSGSGTVTLSVAAGAATDFAGNPSGAASTSVQFDATGPDVRIDGDLQGRAVRRADFPGVISGTATDPDTGISRVAVAVRRSGTGQYFDGTGFNSPTLVYFTAAGTTEFSYGFPTGQFPADDTYQFLVQATDTAGNQFVTPLSVTIDDTAPAPVITTPVAGTLVTAEAFERDGRRISGTSSDATAGLTGTSVAVQRSADGAYFDGTSFVQSAGPIFVPASGTPAAFSLPGLSADRLLDGQYVVTARSTDRAGNVGTATSRFVFDNAAPRPVLLLPANGSGFNAAGFPGSLSGRVADAGDTARVDVTLQRRSDGLYWNGSFFGSATPVLLPTTLTVNTDIEVDPRLVVDPTNPEAETSTTFSYTFSPFGFPAEGFYTFTAIATDKAGGVGTAVSTFSFDNSAPTSTLNPPSGTTTFSPGTFPAALTGTASDTLSGVGLVQVSLRQVGTGRFFDGTGFNSPTETKLAAVLSSPGATSTGWTFAVPPAALPADDQYLFSVYAADVAGNVQAFGTPYAFNFDATRPQATVTADRGAVTNVAPLVFVVGFSAPVTGLDPAGLVVQNGTVLDVTRQSDTLFLVRVTPLADGAVSLAVTSAAARDAAGNTTLPAGPAVGQFDRTAPTVTLTAAGGAVPQGQPVTLTATFSEPVVGFGPGSLRVTNGTVLGVTGGGTTYQIQVLPGGPGVVGVSIAGGGFADAAGNSGVASVEVTRTSEDPRYAVAVGNVVRTYDSRNGLRGQSAPFGDDFTGTVRVATADFNADGIPDVLAGTGPGGATDVRVLDGVTGQVIFQVNPFEESFTGGVYVTAGDLTGDGVPEVVITPDVGGGPRVRIFDGASFAQLSDFFGIADSAFRGGARATVGDVNGDGVGDLVVAAGVGGGPRVAVFDGRSVAGGANNLQRVVGDFFAYEQTLRNGVFVAAGDIDGDGVAELVTAGGPGGGPRVTVLDGADLAAGTLTRTADFFAGDPDSRSGARVAVKAMTGDGTGSLIVGDGERNVLRVYTAAGLGASPPAASFEQDLLPGVDGDGVFVG